MSEIHEASTPIAQLERPAALLEPRVYKIESPSDQSFAELVKNEKTKRVKNVLLN